VVKKKIIVETLDQLESTAKVILSACPNHRIFAFYGEMGAGKTTLIKAICRELNTVDETSSPTFSIVNEYQLEKEERVFHFDFYRLEQEEEAYNLGIEELLDSGAYCFIEWPQNVRNLLPENSVKIDLSLKDQTRIIKLSI